MNVKNLSAALRKGIKRILTNHALPVIRGNMKGLKVVMNPLLNASIFYKDYEPDKQKAFDLFIKDGTVVFDIGANLGLHSLYISKVKPASTIYAFEPLPDNIRFLKKNKEVNHKQNIKVVESAVGSFDGESFFETGESNYEGSLTDNVTAQKVNVITLDNFVSRENVLPGFMKIDIEGAEYDLLCGFKKTLRQHKPVMIIELHDPVKNIQVAALLEQEGYAIYRLNGEDNCTDRQLLYRVKKPDAVWPDPEGVWGNILAVPQPDMPLFEKYLAN